MERGEILWYLSNRKWFSIFLLSGLFTYNTTYSQSVVTLEGCDLIVELEEKPEFKTTLIVERLLGEDSWIKEKTLNTLRTHVVIADLEKWDI